LKAVFYQINTFGPKPWFPASDRIFHGGISFGGKKRSVFEFIHVDQAVFSQHPLQTLVNRIVEMSPPVLADKQLRRLQKETIQERILFGTDFFMNCVRLKGKNYWSYFEDHPGSDFETIAGANPRRFLFSA